MITATIGAGSGTIRMREAPGGGGFLSLERGGEVYVSAEDLRRLAAVANALAWMAEHKKGQRQ